MHAIELACAALAMMLVAGTSLAQDMGKGDMGKGDPSWERIDSVLVVPPVYRPETATPADACAEDCPRPNRPDNPGLNEPPVAVAGSADDPTNASAGTADNPTGESAAIDGSAPDGSGLQERQEVAADSQQDTDGGDGSLGSAEDYQEQQAAALALGNYGVAPVPYVIIGVPVRSYRTSAISAAARPTSIAPRSMLARPAWMPQPMARVAPLPPMVSRRFQPNVGGFPGGVGGGFGGSLPRMSGFRAGFRSR